jgi:hypothetical protein
MPEEVERRAYRASGSEVAGRGRPALHQQASAGKKQVLRFAQDDKGL